MKTAIGEKLLLEKLSLRGIKEGPTRRWHLNENLNDCDKQRQEEKVFQTENKVSIGISVGMKENVRNENG